MKKKNQRNVGFKPGTLFLYFLRCCYVLSLPMSGHPVLVARRITPTVLLDCRLRSFFTLIKWYRIK